MTTALILTAIAATFVIGFLLSERRAVKQCNAILDAHVHDLLRAMMEEPSLAEPPLPGEEPARQTVH